MENEAERQTFEQWIECMKNIYLAARASESSPPQPDETLQRIREILFSAMEMKESSLEQCDRSALELAMIASNAIFWRQREIDKLRGAAATAPSAPPKCPVCHSTDPTDPGKLNEAPVAYCDHPFHEAAPSAPTATLESLLPETFYADRTLEFRITMLVEQWQRAIQANQELEAKLLAPTATDWMRQASEEIVETHCSIGDYACDATQHSQMTTNSVSDIAGIIRKYAGEHAGADKEKP